MLSVKGTHFQPQPPPPPHTRTHTHNPVHLCSASRFRGGLSCVRADTGIFTLAKQGSCIDLCDCDEFGIVIWIYWLMWPSEYRPSLTFSTPSNSYSQPTCCTEDNGDFKCNKWNVARSICIQVICHFGLLWLRVNAQKKAHNTSAAIAGNKARVDIIKCICQYDKNNNTYRHWIILRAYSTNLHSTTKYARTYTHAPYI